MTFDDSKLYTCALAIQAAREAGKLTTQDLVDYRALGIINYFAKLIPEAGAILDADSKWWRHARRLTWCYPEQQRELLEAAKTMNLKDFNKEFDRVKKRDRPRCVATVSVEYTLKETGEIDGSETTFVYAGSRLASKTDEEIKRGIEQEDPESPFRLRVTEIRRADASGDHYDTD